MRCRSAGSDKERDVASADGDSAVRITRGSPEASWPLHKLLLGCRGDRPDLERTYLDVDMEDGDCHFAHRED
jgi:hypothetical protein